MKLSLALLWNRIDFYLQKLRPSLLSPAELNKTLRTMIINLIIVTAVSGLELGTYIHALSDAKQYHADCSSVGLPGSTALHQTACYEVKAEGEYQRADGIHGLIWQHIKLHLPYNKTDYATLPDKPEQSARGIDGVCVVQYWHGDIPAVYAAKGMIECESNPDYKARFAKPAVVTFTTVDILFMVLVFVTIKVWWQRKAESKRRN